MSLNNYNYNDTSFGCTIFTILMFGVSFFAWVTHIATCVAAHAWILLAIGAIMIPIGVIHGIMIWFGAGAV